MGGFAPRALKVNTHGAYRVFRGGPSNSLSDVSMQSFASLFPQLAFVLASELRATGRAFISSTRIRGRVVLRFCFVNWRTTAADVEEIVVLLNRLASELR